MTRIAIASCCKISGQKKVNDQLVWSSIQSAKPDLLLLLGDNVYMRQTGPRWQLDHLKQMYDEQLAEAHFKKILADVPFMTIWDDHDFGPNDSRGDSDRDRPFRDASRKLFHRAWKNAINSNRPNIYCSHVVGEVKVIMLDGRYHRTDARSPSRRTILGDEQEAWLRDELQHDARYTIVGCGTPLLGSPEYKDAWAAYPEAQGRLVEMLRAAKRLIYVSGDIHKNKFVKHHGFYEVTSSGVARIETGETKSSDNYGILEFAKQNVTITLNGSIPRNQTRKIIRSNTWELA